MILEMCNFDNEERQKNRGKDIDDVNYLFNAIFHTFDITGMEICRI